MWKNINKSHVLDISAFVAFKHASKGNFVSSWGSLGAAWSLLHHVGPPRSLSGLILGPSWLIGGFPRTAPGGSWGQFWACLGSSWAGLASFWAWVSSSWASSWALRAHLQIPRTLQKSSIFKMPPRCLKMALRWLKMAPRGLQDGSKMLPRWVKAKWKSKTSSKVDVLQAPVGKVKYRSGSNSSSGRSR